MQVMLFVAGRVGAAIYKHVLECGDEIVPPDAQACDWIITAWIDYLIHPDVLKKAKVGTVNAHPALLPYGRGWYPHVHHIIDGTQAGVTLHKLTEKADAGDIWAQAPVPIYSWDTAKDVYVRQEDELILLFKRFWIGIRDGVITATPQDESKAVYFKKKDVDYFNKISTSWVSMTLINKLRARTFGDKAYAYFIDEQGNKVYVGVFLKKEGSMSEGPRCEKCGVTKRYCVCPLTGRPGA